MKIHIALPLDRSKLGFLQLLDDDGALLCGPFQVDGQSDLVAAVAAGNPSRNPEQPYGNTPTGSYDGLIDSEPDTPTNRRSYGAPDAGGCIPIIDLRPLQENSQAWRAFLNKRTGLLIHSGDLNGAGGLRPTHGCVRMFPCDIVALMLALKNSGVHGVPVTIEQSQPQIPT